MAKLNLTPLSASYTFAEPAQVLHQSLPGGLPRQRAGMIGGMARLVSTTYVCNKSEYEYLVRFVRQNIADDCPVIQIDLLVTDSTLLEYDAYIVPDTFTLDAIDGITFTCSIQLNVIPLDTESVDWPTGWTAGVFQLPPDKSSYTIKYGSEILSVQHDGNTPKVRRTYFNASRFASLRWHCDPAQFVSFFEAYRYWVESGGDPFYMDLIMDYARLTRHRCTFVPGSVRLSSHQGHLHIIEADLEIESDPWPFSYISHGDGSGGGGPVESEIAWYNPIGTNGGTLVHSNSGTGTCDSFSLDPVTTLYAGLVDWTDETVSWSISWSSGGSHSSPVITDAADGWVQIDWVNFDASPGFIYEASIGTLTLTATVNGTPIAIGQRLLAVTATTEDPDYPSIAWGPE